MLTPMLPLFRFDAIVLDIMLPGKQGLDVLRELRQFQNLQEQRCLLS